MSEDIYRIKKYEESDYEEWDSFIESESINGTFLHTRRFLGYHPKKRFIDHSLMFYNGKNHLVAVCPACEIVEDNRTVFYSHKGSTYGGLVLSNDIYKAKHIIPLVKSLEAYLYDTGFQEIYLKSTPDILSINKMALLEYALYYCGYSEFKELNPIIDFKEYKDDIKSNFSQGKRTHVNRCIREGMITRPIMLDDEVREYYPILCENLSKYELKPVHTVDELLEFKNSRLKNECEFYGTFLGNEMVAGGMMFYFHKVRVAHTQYLSAKSEYLKLSPVTFLYYSIIDEMKKRGFKRLSWGICTEEYGKYLNESLIGSKEDFGGTYSNNHTYYKKISC